MTALPIIETQAGDISAYIPTNVIRSRWSRSSWKVIYSIQEHVQRLMLVHLFLVLGGSANEGHEESFWDITS